MFKLVLMLAAPLALGALPPLSAEEREQSATHILEGRVLTLKKELIEKNWHYTARVKVWKFLKAELFSEQNAEVVTVKYWKAGPRPTGWTGSQGQNGQMFQGDQIRLYLVSAGEPDTYTLLMPNGWELLPKEHVYYANLMDEDVWVEEDEQDLYDLEDFGPWTDDWESDGE
jgi:hypothetical protein